MTYIIAIITSLLLLSACNNDRTQRLNASFHCKEDRDLSFNLSDDEESFLNEASLPDNETLEAISFTTFVELVDTNENRIFMTLSGSNTANGASVSALCTRGLNPSSALSSPAIFNIPLKNGAGEFTELEITIQGKADEGENLPFATVTSRVIEPSVESSSEEAEEESSPQPFAAYFEGDETATYQRKDGDNKENEYLYHIKSNEPTNGIVNSITRMNLVKIITSED